ncbi:MAG: uroporphyrinogen-III synthase, partial [Crocinitomicaceae bacterium]
MAIKTILVSQPKPEGDKSPYFDLAEKYKLKIDFRPFIKVEGIDAKEFRAQRVNIAEHTAIILTSKVAVDHFFRIA